VKEIIKIHQDISEPSLDKIHTPFEAMIGGGVPLVILEISVILFVQRFRKKAVLTLSRLCRAKTSPITPPCL
jgi:hypothetical protein